MLIATFLNSFPDVGIFKSNIFNKKIEINPTIRGNDDEHFLEEETAEEEKQFANPSSFSRRNVGSSIDTDISPVQARQSQSQSNIINQNSTKPKSDVEDLEILFHLRLLDDAIEKVLYELGELTAMRLIGVSRERFEKMVLTVAKTLANAAEEIEAVHRLEKAVKG